MQLDTIRSFVATVDQASMTRAAALLGLSKSTVSEHIRLLEGSLGAKLLLTTSRQFSLTATGRAYYEECAAALADLERAGERVKWLHQHPSGTLRITAPTELSMHLLAPILADFALKHADIKVELDLTNRNLDLRSEGLDLALRMGGTSDGSLVARPLAQFSRHLFASPDYLSRAGMPATPLQLMRHQCLLFRRDAVAAPWQLRRAGETAEVEVHGRLGVNSMGFVREALLNHCGIGILPDFMTVADEAAGRLLRVLPDWELAPAQLSAVTPGRRLAARTRAFIDFLTVRLALG